MSFSDHKITEFIHRVGDLPDQPTLSPQELKQRFDSSPEELRKAVNSICDEGERLSARVEGIVMDTFGDTIDREMLSHELAAELDGKAEQTALAAETAARENLAETVAQKCECYFGTYTGDGKASQLRGKTLRKPLRRSANATSAPIPATARRPSLSTSVLRPRL